LICSPPPFFSIILCTFSPKSIHSFFGLFYPPFLPLFPNLGPLNSVYSNGFTNPLMRGVAYPRVFTVYQNVPTKPKYPLMSNPTNPIPSWQPLALWAFITTVPFYLSVLLLYKSVPLDALTLIWLRGVAFPHTSKKFLGKPPPFAPHIIIKAKAITLIRQIN
jgi:hypothetical protein